MARKFACIEFMKTIEEIPLRFNILKKAPLGVLEWYVKKFNPFVLEEMSIAGEPGYRVKLPAIEKDVPEKEEFVVDIMLRTIESLKAYGVDIIMPPRGYIYALDEGVAYADAGSIFAFCLMPAVFKAIKVMKIDMKKAEFLIVGGNESLTRAILDNLYPEVNFLAIIPDPLMQEDAFTEVSEEIFADTGLNIHICGMSKSVLESADIVINTAERYEGSDYAFKRGAVYFDLSGDTAHCMELAYKREDMLVVNDLRIKYDNELLTLKPFSMACYLKTSDFRRFLRKGYERQTSRRIIKDMESQNYSVISFCLNDTVVSLSGKR